MSLWTTLSGVSYDGCVHKDQGALVGSASDCEGAWGFLGCGFHSGCSVMMQKAQSA